MGRRRNGVLRRSALSDTLSPRNTSLLVTALLSALLALVVLSGTAGAVTDYDVRVENETAYVDATVEIYSPDDEGATAFRLGWEIPDGARVTSVSDRYGSIDDYEVSGSTLELTTNRGPRRKRAVVEISLRIPDTVSRRYGGLRVVNLSLAGFDDGVPDAPDEVTQVTVNTDAPVWSETHTFGFEHELRTRQGKVTYKGEGAVNLHLAVGTPRREYDHYAVFGDAPKANLSAADRTYGIVPSVTGLSTQVEKHPVVVLSDKEYDRRMNPWSAGEYTTGGVIVLRSSVVEKGPEGAPVVLHETAHAYNQKALGWANSNPMWFDEGVAEYVGFLAHERLGIRQPELFGSERSWRERCRDGDAVCTYTLNPNQVPSDLWGYYTGTGSYADVDMKIWTPSSSSPEVRRFGYAFSELLVRNYVRLRGSDALHPVYDELLSINRTVSSRRASSERVLRAMGTDMEPCYYGAGSRRRFGNCLDEIHSMNTEIPDFNRTTKPDDGVTLSEIDEESPSSKGPVSGLLQVLGAVFSFFARLLGRLTEMFSLSVARG